MIKRRRNSSRNSSWKLVALTPEYQEPDHGSYVEAVEEALGHPGIRNIALSGSYGVGKSSILQEVARRLPSRVVELSLSTLTPIETSTIDESVPRQATTQTNRIQQEIVKQLLYRERPDRAPSSRFRRIERFSWRRELATAGLLGFIAAVIFLLAEWSDQIAAVFAPVLALGFWVHPIVWVIASAIVLALRLLLHGRVRIKQLSAGPAAVTLDDRSATYFDQYLDEIVYFFEVSRRDIVIFEDIDRFNDSHIFETLSTLNTLLNASPQIKKTIRFIYATRDSIFDQIELKEAGRDTTKELDGIDDPAEAETVRANRTKFFDLVIPVVPFITHRSARNLVAQLLAEIRHEVSPDLTDLAGQYVPEMRLLKNVRNEFIVFRGRIFSGDGTHLGLDETDLFAMMLYKNTHLADFEAIRLGKSNLDSLYAAWRALVIANIQRIEREIRDARRRIAHPDSIRSRSNELGTRLINRVDAIQRIVNYQRRPGQFILAGRARTRDEVTSGDFWVELLSVPDNQTLEWNNAPYGQRMVFTRANLSAILGDDLKPEDWHRSDRESLEESLRDLAEDLAFLRRADIGDLVQRPDFVVHYGDAQRSLDTIAQELLGKGLAYQFVRAGYINRNFTLYTSTFHGDRVSPAAMNFIIHHVEQDVMDEHFELDADDVDAVVRERGEEALREPALYNIAILDHLLRADESGTSTSAAEIMIGSLTQLGADQTRFVQAYLSSGAQSAPFIRRFTAKSDRVLVYLVDQVELDDEARLELVSTALGALTEGREYRLDGEVSSYLAAHYAEFTALTATSLDNDQAKRIAGVFEELSIKVPSLVPLSRAVRHAFVAQELYELNRENLCVALDAEESLALDVVHDANTVVYSYVLRNLEPYLAATDGFSATVDASDSFDWVIENVLGNDATWLSEVVKRASSGCTIARLAKVSQEAWSALAENGRFPTTFENVSSYIEAVGSIDDSLATVLKTTGCVSDHEEIADDAKVELAKTILNASDALPSSELRVQLVESLKLSHYIDATEVAPEKGELFALLLAHDIIEDSEAAYARLAETDWATRESLICASQRFKDYMTPTLASEDLAALLRSNRVAVAIKNKLVDEASQYFVEGTADDLRKLAQFVVGTKLGLPLDIIEKMATSGVPSQQIITLLQPHFSTIDFESLAGILQSLGEEYDALTSVGRDRPKIPKVPDNLALLEYLQKYGPVNSFKSERSKYKVYKKYKE